MSGKYALGDKLGGGGMAEVFRANVIGAEGFSRPVAIKRVLPEHSANSAFAEMFISEARISARLLHPNVVNVLDFDRDELGRLFLVMEMVEGVDLRRLLQTGPVPPSVLIHVTIEALRGLGYAHALANERGKPLGIVHRDVSPDNVLISWDGAVKVSDFGIAKAYAATNATRSGLLKGKVIYMSPEQANAEELDGRADLFSVGMMLYRALVGRVPFDESLGVMSYLRQLCMVPITSPLEACPDVVPADLSGVVMNLLEKDPIHRCPTAATAIDALRACRDFSPHAGDELVTLLRERFPNKAPVRTAEHVAPRADAATLVPAPAPEREPKGKTQTASPKLAQSYPTPAMVGQRGPTSPSPSSRRGLFAVLGIGVVAAAAVTLAMTLRGGSGATPADGASEVVPAATMPVDVADAQIAAPALVDAGVVDALTTPATKPIPIDAKPAKKRSRRKPKKTTKPKPSSDQPDWDLTIEPSE